MPLFTVITICKNNQSEIERTMESILLQKCTDYQYIVIDGASTDDTLQKIREKEKEFIRSKRSITVISEPDTGIYNAMNKGIAMAEGTYIIFINCGDILYSSDTLQEQKRILTEENPDYDIYYGDFVLKSYSMFWIQKGDPDVSCIKSCLPSSHQSMFVRTEVAKQYPFNEDYKIAGDIDFFINAMKGGKRFFYTERIVAVVADGGLSMDYPESRKLEVAKLSLKHGLITKSEYDSIIDGYKKIHFTSQIRRGIKKIVPAWVGKQWRKRQKVWQNSIPSDFSDFA